MPTIWARLTLPALLMSIAVHPYAAAETAPPAEPREDIAVHRYIDREAAGWALKNNDEAFVAEQEGCRIQWNAVELKPLAGEARSRRLLRVKRCKLPFDSELALHRAILKAIDAKWRLSSFDTVSWGSFQSDGDISWNLPIALACAKSRDYRDYRLHYPHSRLKSLNSLFVVEANRLGVFMPLKNLFRELGLEIELASVEKVFTPKAGELPNYQELRALGIARDAKVVWDVADSYFRIRKAE
jgi:hypothetical protein